MDVALKLAQCDIYERRLREQVRRKRVARDYQLVSKFYEKNPIVTIGKGAVISPQKISSQVKAVKRGEGPKAELVEALKGVTQFHTAQEFQQFVDNLCVEKVSNLCQKKSTFSQTVITYFLRLLILIHKIELAPK